jgi:hypothetical protein
MQCISYLERCRSVSNQTKIVAVAVNYIACLTPSLVANRLWKSFHQNRRFEMVRLSIQLFPFHDRRRSLLYSGSSSYRNNGETSILLQLFAVIYFCMPVFAEAKYVANIRGVLVNCGWQCHSFTTCTCGTWRWDDWALSKRRASIAKDTAPHPRRKETRPHLHRCESLSTRNYKFSTHFAIIVLPCFFNLLYPGEIMDHSTPISSSFCFIYLFWNQVFSIQS